ncbi:MAG TPA: exo-beta-N-acetylmuramidase NamZ domain-containing protein [Pyrinomonadaceae bacterium]|nr:exo-beta-N-acetylmuramidase NamZ domain-containing protein [Pyrinomonadaceae bacterium]
MFERYTEKARRVIFFARYEASQFGSESINPEHLLLGLLREDKTLLKHFVSEAGATMDALRKDVESHIKTEQKIHTAVEIPLAVETKRALGYAHEESDGLKHRHIGTEHLLLGLLRQPDTLAAQALRRAGVELEKVRETISSHGTGTFRTHESHTHMDTSVITTLRAYAQGLLTLSESIERRALSASDNVLGEASAISRAKGQGRHVELGVERLLREKSGRLSGERVGLVCNQSSVDHHFRHAADLFHEHKEINLTALFGPQHGIRGDVQDNMVETGHAVDRATGLPIYSLYSETREPTEEMLEKVDVLVFDMQDVGCRIYTFIYTMANCMRAARRLGKRVVVCDRPNPITGEGVAGNVLESEYASFVGQYPIPTRHGMTVCELARLFNEEFGIGCELETVTMEGWRREAWMDETDAPWVMPSPNMPTLDTAIVFPGTVHLEGTQMSEGRGTTRPFEIVGAPYIDAERYARRLNELVLPGVYFRACGFQPTFQKHAGVPCGGVQIHVLDRQAFEPVMTGVATVLLAQELYPEDLRWKEPPYEYVFDKNPFDVIAGTNRLRAAIERGDSLETIVASWQKGLDEFKKLRSRFLLY